MVGRAVLVQLGAFDIAADNRAATDLALPQVGVAEFGADHQQCVAVRCGVLQRPQPNRCTDRQWVRLVENALAVDGGGHRRTECLGEGGQLGLRVDGTATGNDERPVGAREEFGRAANHVAVGDRRCGGRVDPRLAGPLLLKHVDRDLDVHRPRASSGEPAERLGHRRRGFVRAANPAAPCDELIHCATDVLGFVQLTQVEALRAGGHTRRHQQHGLGFGVRGGRRRHRVGQAGPARGDHHAGASADPGVRLCRIARTLFVAWRDGADPVGVEVPVQLEIVRAGDAEQGVDAVCGKGFHDGRAAVAVIVHALAANTDSSS